MKAKAKLRERDIEQYLVRQVQKIGGKAFKFSSPGNRAVPDRICCLPKGHVVFVECKAPGRKPTPLQARTIQAMRNHDHEVLIIDSKEMVDVFCESVLEVIKEEVQNAK